MKFIRPAIIAVFVSLLTFVGATAQTKPATTPPVKPTTPQTTTPTTAGGSTGKIGLIDSRAFDDPKLGLTRYVAAEEAVNAFFKKELDELKLVGTRAEALEAELTKLEQQANATPDPKVPLNIDQLKATFATKKEEYDRVVREYKFKQEDLKIRYQNKTGELVGPVMKEIMDGLQEYAKANGFAIIFDSSKMLEQQIIIGGDVSVEVTADFVKFFNARVPKPSTTGTVTKK